MNVLQNLRAVVAALKLEPHQPGPITTNGPSSNFIRARLAPPGMIGILVCAAEAWQNLVRGLFDSDVRYQRGITSKEFQDETFEALLELFFGVAPDKIGNAEVQALQDRMLHWFLENFDDYTSFVPCAIVPVPAPPFTIGPVGFQTVDGFDLGGFAHTEFAADGLERLKSKMAARDTSWMATAPVADVHEKRAPEFADLVVDVALAILQLIVPLNSSRHMARLYDGRGPRIRIDLLARGSRVVANSHAGNEAGFGLMPGVLEKILADSPQVLGATGMHLSALALNRFSHPSLQMAWCDAAYWFRQGVRDNLDSIAVTKLETAMEVMLSAGSATMGRDRLYLAIQDFYGRKRHDVLNADSATTIKQFVERLVTDRSRVLHGSLSTLATPMAVSRGQLESFCKTMLRAMAVELEHYIAIGGADDIDEFLAWAPSSKHKPSK